MRILVILPEFTPGVESVYHEPVKFSGLKLQSGYYENVAGYERRQYEKK
jgi:hypothetical protein